MFWFDGRLNQHSDMNLSADDPALKFGASVFTTMRLYERSLEHPLTYWEGHRDRVSHSLQTFHWPQPDWLRVYTGCTQLAEHYPVLRIAVFPDGRELITGRQLPADLATQQRQGVMAWVAEGYARSLPAHKTGNYLASWLAIQQARHHGASEVILTNPAGEWLETSTGNLWGWKDGHWWTPPLSCGILPGLVRQRLMAHLKQRVKEALWSSQWTAEFEAVAYSNCVVELLPIRTIIGPKTKLEYNPTHPALAELRQLFCQTDPGS
ncbi:aminotransferase class IV [Romeria aff. gracilis LEGE 07310]|uniref:Aminotransferase class IV n=2 Tax=Vasconcelosia TaxID=3366328 RepID=A0A8J7ALJ1_9CYAN|nr:aminotransferase class IV [Romeria aff. gracilis LEGE 07310]